MIGSAFRNVVSLSEIYFRAIRIRKEHIKTQAFPVEGIAPTSAEFRIGRVFDSAVSIIDQIFSISVKICIPEVSGSHALRIKRFRNLGIILVYTVELEELECSYFLTYFENPVSTDCDKVIVSGDGSYGILVMGNVE